MEREDQKTDSSSRWTGVFVDYLRGSWAGVSFSILALLFYPLTNSSVSSIFEFNHWPLIVLAVLVLGQIWYAALFFMNRIKEEEKAWAAGWEKQMNYNESETARILGKSIHRRVTADERPQSSVE